MAEFKMEVRFNPYIEKILEETSKNLCQVEKLLKQNSDLLLEVLKNPKAWSTENQK